MERVIDATAMVLAAAAETGRSARDVLAERPDLRALPQADRARLRTALHQVTAWQRRWHFLLGGDRVFAGVRPAARWLALTLAFVVVERDLTPPEAARILAARHPLQLDFSPLLDAEPALAAVPDEAERFALRWSLPDWLAAEVRRAFGADAAGLAAAWNAPPPRTLRCNTLRTDRAALAATLAATGIPTRPTAYAPHGLLALGHGDLFATAAYAAGHFEQQDEASQLAVLAVAPPPQGRVLDICAGSGGKTLALAAALGNRGLLWATDVHHGRLAALRERAARAGVSNLRAVACTEHAFPDEVLAFARRADRLLLDAPCSGSGSLRRRPEARWTMLPGMLASLGATQRDLVFRAAAVLQPGARLCYATCSLFAAENEQVIGELLAADPGLETVRLAEVLGRERARPIADATGTFLALRPDRHGTDGFFAAIVRRRR